MKPTISTTWNYDPLPALDQPSVAYLLVDASYDEAQATTGDAHPLNVSLVLDASGSMAGAKLLNLKRAVDWVIDNLGPQDTLAVTLFDEEVRPLVPSGPVRDPEQLHKEVAAVREAGGTAMSKGMRVGLEEALKGKKQGAVSRLVLLTDGQTWGDTDDCKQIAAEAGQAGIPITALGVGADEDWSIELLDAIATASGGHVDYIAKPEDMARTFEEAIGQMQDAALHNMRLIFTPTRGVSLRSVNRVSPTLAKLWAPEEHPAPDTSAGAPVELQLGDIQSGGVQSLLFEVVLPSRKPGQYKLAQIGIMGDVAGGASSQAITVDAVAAFASGAGKGPGDARVMNSVERATTLKLQTRALQAEQAGDIPNATRNLRAAATRLLNIGESDLAEQAEQEAQRLEAMHAVVGSGSAGTRKLAFSTRKLALQETGNTSDKKAATVRFDE
ncbi:MAG: VWA domain-containing protein [Chloroflexota bacterium]|nr:VWA domain-containing protein [Chloroflexota bacterium]